MTFATGPRANISSFLSMDIAAAAIRLQANGTNIARLDVGQPAWGAPLAAREAACAALQAGQTLGYTTAFGRDDLRAGLSRWYSQRYGLDVPAERFVITTGSSAGFVLAFLATLAEGARVAMAAPYYPPYRQILTSLGFASAIARPDPSAGYQLRAHHLPALETSAPLGAILIASPANPTGAMMARQDLQALCASARERAIPLISDEIYHGLEWGQPAVCALECDDDAIIISSFSKWFAMTGWRIGWMIVPPYLLDAVERLQQNVFISAPNISQLAALAALGEDAQVELRAHASLMAANRASVLDWASKIGARTIAPADGAFYVYAQLPQCAGDSLGLCRDLLQRAQVAISPGIDFDLEGGGDWVRLAYARHAPEIAIGLQRLQEALAR